jgi:hypothetical protein
MNSIGSKRITADGEVTAAGKPTRVYGVILKGSGATTVTLKNGGTGGTEYDVVTSADGAVVRVNYPGGLFFPSGCYGDVGDNITYATFIVEKEG